MSKIKRLLILLTSCIYLGIPDVIVASSSLSVGKNMGKIPSWIYPRPFSYNPKTNPDIFQPFINPTTPTTPQIKNKNRRKGPLSPLEKIQPSQLKLVGIVISKEVKPLALVELPNGKGYILKLGTKIGVNHGRVIKIGPNFVIIQEKTINILGKEVNKNTILKLHTPQGEGK